jgi:hypothetical protein
MIILVELLRSTRGVSNLKLNLFKILKIIGLQNIPTHTMQYLDVNRHHRMVIDQWLGSVILDQEENY